MLHLPLSKIFASSIQYSNVLFVLDLSFGFFHCPGDKCPTVDMSNALRIICFFGSAGAGAAWSMALGAILDSQS
jgi:hypothetical protein